jgi:hypothetical protein
MAKMEVLAEKAYAKGVTSIAAMQVPKGAIQAVIRAKRLTWPTKTLATKPVAVIRCNLEISYDAGITWRLLLAFTALGGVVLTKDGLVSTESYASTKMDKSHYDADVRLVRGEIECFDPLTTVVNVEFN